MQCLLLIIISLFNLTQNLDFPNSAENYCNVQCPDNTKHTLCLNPLCQLRPPCTGLPQFSEEDQQEIVDFHNLIRNKVAFGEVIGQPSARNMREITWDFQLQQLAECWAQYCASTIGCSHILPRFNVTQSLSVKQYSNETTPYQISTYKKLLMEWFQQYKGFKLSKNLDYHESGYELYTQMVWAETYLIGCARNKFQTQINESVLIFICNYGPGGNIQNMTAYLRGYRCTGCRGSLECRRDSDYRGLCTVVGESLTEVIWKTESLDGVRSYGSRVEPWIYLILIWISLCFDWGCGGEVFCSMEACEHR